MVCILLRKENSSINFTNNFDGSNQASYSIISIGLAMESVTYNIVEVVVSGETVIEFNAVTATAINANWVTIK